MTSSKELYNEHTSSYIAIHIICLSAMKATHIAMYVATASLYTVYV